VAKGATVLKTGRILTTVAAATGSLLLAAGQAGAAPYGQTVSTNSNWSCAPTVVHTAKAGVGFQACLVRNLYDDAQIGLVVVNNSTSAVTISNDVYSDFALSASCSSYNLAVGERRGCFGTTDDVPVCENPPGSNEHVSEIYEGSVELRVNGTPNSTESPSTQCVS
jgi:hypothetical protein